MREASVQGLLTRELRRTKERGGHSLGLLVWLLGERLREELSKKLTSCRSEKQVDPLKAPVSLGAKISTPYYPTSLVTFV